MTPHERPRIAAAILRRAGEKPDAGQLADTVVALWREIDAALSPIIGQRGLAALHGRSLDLVAREFAWLRDARDNSVMSEIDFGVVRRMFVLRPPEESHDAALAVFRCFHDLLAGMVGESLTERLLHAIWDNPFGGQAAQDVSE
jgi:hypothetical protein